MFLCGLKFCKHQNINPYNPWQKIITTTVLNANKASQKSLAKN